jgi:hypothetical protein
MDHLFKHELDEGDRAHRRRVASRIAKHESVRSIIDGGGVELPDCFWIAASGVFGDVHYFEAE